MKNGFRVIDSDMHIMEPLDLWDKYMDARRFRALSTTESCVFGMQLPVGRRRGCSAWTATIGNVCQLMGDDNLVFSSDNPNSDSDFPKATKEFFHQEMPADKPKKNSVG
jgi:hypothetical protein